MRKIKLMSVVFGVIAVMLLSFAGCAEKKNEPFTYRAPSKPKTESGEEGDEDSKLYEILDLDMENSTIELMSLDNPSYVVRYRYNLSTKFKNKYGDSTSIVNFTKGMVVETGELTGTSVLSSVQISDAVWDYDNVDNFLIEAEKNSFSIGKNAYQIKESTKIFLDGEEITLNDISSDDILRVIGMDNKIISVIVTTGHGYIQLKNTGDFVNSLIFIGNGIAANITGDMSIEVPEGTYKVTVANNGYGGTAEYTVTRGQVTEVDLGALKGEGPKICELKFESEVAGVSVYLDDKQVAVGQEMDVKYGKHKLTVKAEGYDSWTKTLVVNSASATISLDLEDEQEESAATTGGSASGSQASESTQSSSSGTSGTSSSSSTTSSSGSTQSTGSKSDESKDAELEYLTTIRDMLSTMTN
ncbi:MAG: PEGA domain-containing protein [Lachnospiraceae bacterium]|nr:PEGA domain-containing protein [Lachnospiraceae bacterium]